MLKTGCVNPEIIAALSKCGHGDKVLIGSGNFPLESQTNPQAERIYMNLSPGLPTSSQVLEALLHLINAEGAEVICPPDLQGEPEVFLDYKNLLEKVELKKYSRDEFYEACRSGSVRVVIESADQRAFSNILLTVGVVRQGTVSTI
ncbi:RbsD/FucU family protein [Murimonas intestini]|uniref:L-fucose mutarotase n=1 Tax=Murimonas intestini TaxID=1337051 RepID=A0AB73T329_9FIRM|nr:RbsD/FucU family protein [Murimonas intestini]MCR1841596.1 RbsD/FucU family protein [Murimonas intestini]MCR1868482.1 RbsD/FucU family protein [Murimonas intestini]MCR1886083.1 RbsD/FucU family protein [Murimonas intestini]